MIAQTENPYHMLTGNMLCVRIKISAVSNGTVPTFINTAAEATLVASSSIDKLHVRTHVGLTAVAADWSSLTMIYDVQRSL